MYYILNTFELHLNYRYIRYKEGINELVVKTGLLLLKRESRIGSRPIFEGKSFPNPMRGFYPRSITYFFKPQFLSYFFQDQKWHFRNSRRLSFFPDL